MISFKLSNGKYLHINAKVKCEFYPTGDVEIIVDNEHLRFNSKNHNVSTSLTEGFYGENPSYLKESSESVQPIKHSQIPQSSKDKELIKDGKKFFNDFLDIWQTNWGIEGEEQPDRANLLINTMNDFSLPIFKYIKSTGGLTHAVMHIIPCPNGNYADLEFKTECRLLAENIAQVSSILCPPLSDLLEYPFPLKTKVGA